MDIYTRQQAKQLGLKQYYTSKPCKHGHISKRYTAGAACVECSQIRSHREYLKPERKQWVHDNRSILNERSRENGRKHLPKPTRPCPSLCECCGNPPGKRSLHLDHCHDTNIFRGWLCVKCNAGLGHLNDNREGVLKALAYLDRG